MIQFVKVGDGGEICRTQVDGITLRDIFAMAAMQAVIARDNECHMSGSATASDAYYFADAMLAARKQDGKAP